MKECDERLLHGDCDGYNDKHSINRHTRFGVAWKAYTRSISTDPRTWMVVGYIFILHAALLLAGIRLLPKNQDIRSPADIAIEFESQTEHATDHHQYSKYSGPPSPEVNHAWAQLVEPTFFGASADELRSAKESVDDSVRLADYDGYLTSLGVYHEIHCLRKMRHFVYQETFYPNVTEGDMEQIKGHLDHCIETLRISTMCTADVSLYTFRWGPRDGPRRPNVKSNSQRSCVKWEVLDAWSRGRAVDFRPNLLRPTGIEAKVHM